MLGLVLSSLDYAGVHSIYLLDRSSGREIVRETVVPLAEGVVLPDQSGVGTASVRTRGLSLQIAAEGDSVHLRADAEGVVVDLTVVRPPAHESLAVVVPCSATRFQYTVEGVALPVTGRLVVAGDEVAVDGPGAFAVLDHGRGPTRWPGTGRPAAGPLGTGSRSAGSGPRAPA